MPFKPGQSGNPLGRPRIKPILQWCIHWTESKAEKILGRIAEDFEHKQQMKAIELIMAYGVGRPMESHNVDAEIADKHVGSPAEIAAEIAAIVPGAAGEGSGCPIPPPVVP